MVTYGWATKAVERMIELTAGLKAEVIEPVVVKGLPDGRRSAKDRRYWPTLSPRSTRRQG